MIIVLSIVVPLQFCCFHFISFDCCIVSDVVLPFPVLLTTIVDVVVSFMLILEHQNTEQQHKQVKQFVGMMLATTVGMKRNHEEVDNDDDDSGSMKQRMIQYNHNCARRCIQQDYLGRSRIFNHHKFQWIFHITPGVYNCIKVEIEDNNFYTISNYYVTGCPTICIDAKLLVALKHHGYGCAMNAWIDYLQMGEQTGCLCVEMFCKTTVQRTTLHDQYLQPYTSADMQHVLGLHKHVHGVLGVLGLLDCLHIHWKIVLLLTGIISWERRIYTKIVLEALADNNLWFWHAAFGFAGSSNDMNILDISRLHSFLLDGSHAKLSF